MRLYYHPFSTNARRAVLTAAQLGTSLELVAVSARGRPSAPLTLADLALSAPLTVTEPAKLPLSSYPNIQSWLGHMQNLDAWKKTTA